MSELRRNPLTGRWVSIAVGRAARPGTFTPRSLPVQADPDRPCPFCPGHEEATPPALETYGPSGNWLVRVVPNLYPAFDGPSDRPVPDAGADQLFVAHPGTGIHEVLVLSPVHEASWADLDDRQAGLVMAAIRDRVEDHARRRGIAYTQVLLNHGREAGASIEHPHGQLLAIPLVPDEIADEQHGFAARDTCVLCDVVKAEVAAGDRVVLADERVTVLCPWWSGSPYELLIVPNVHTEHLHKAAPPDVAAVGRTLRTVLASLRDRLGDAAYNLVFHTAPLRSTSMFHWHVHVLPKLTTQAGFELGTGVLINVVAPEVAAADLRRTVR